jgi:hypothetical protein
VALERLADVVTASGVAGVVAGTAPEHVGTVAADQVGVARAPMLHRGCRLVGPEPASRMSAAGCDSRGTAGVRSVLAASRAVAVRGMLGWFGQA